MTGEARLSLLLCAFVTCCGALDVGFNQLFTTETTETQNLNIHFDCPLPSYVLGGVLIRNGVGRFEFGNRRFNQVGDGYAKMCSWQFINESTALFNTKYLNTSFYQESEEMNDIAKYLLFGGTMPAWRMADRFKALMTGGDNYIASIHKFGSNEDASYVALTDEWANYRIDPLTLRTIEKSSEDLPGPDVAHYTTFASTSHPLPEYGTDNMISFAGLVNYEGKDTLRLVHITPNNQREFIADIQVDDLPYMHSFGMSKNYAVMVLPPMYFDQSTLMRTASLIDSVTWRAEQGLTLYVVNLHTKEQFPVHTDAIFPYHFINSYEDGDFVYIDYVTYPDASFITAYDLDALRNITKRNAINTVPTIKRFAINVETHEVEIQNLPLTTGLEKVNNLDNPAVNPNYLYQPHCYTWGVILKADDHNLSTWWLGKKNLCQTDCDIHWYRENHYPTEPVFIPKPNSVREDDGVLLSVVLDGERGLSYLAVFDALTMELLSTSDLPFHIPLTVHGKFFKHV